MGKRGRALRTALKVAVPGTALLGLGALLWLLRDPLPQLTERASASLAVEEGPAELGADLVSQSVRLTASNGLAFDLLVRIPAPEPQVASGDAHARSASNRRPLFLILGGYRTGERAAMLVENTRGAVVAAAGYPYDGPLDVSGLAVVRHLPEIRRAILDTAPATKLALDYLLARPDVDPAHVELVGVSFGAFLAPAAAALDPRVTRLWLVHGAGKPRAVLERGLETSVPSAPLRAMVAAVANVILAGPILAPERWLPKVAPRPVVIINASEDERLPREAVEALHAAAVEPKEEIWLAGEHVRPGREDLIREIMDVVLSRARGP